MVAVSFLTRIPVPIVVSSDRELASSAPWFPVVGIMVGAVTAAVLTVGAIVFGPLLSHDVSASGTVAGAPWWSRVDGAAWHQPFGPGSTTTADAEGSAWVAHRPDLGHGGLHHHQHHVEGAAAQVGVRVRAIGLEEHGAT